MAASGGHALQQQKQIVENRLKTLRNEDLKDICRAFREQVSGTKAALQARCDRILNDLVSRGDVAGFEDLKRIGGIFGLASLSQNNTNSSSNTYPSSGYQYNMAPQRGGGGLSQNRLPADGKYFKPSPFYEALQTLSPLQDLPEMPQNRHTVKSNLYIKPEVAQQFRSGESNSLKILLYCGLSHSMSQYSQVDVTFPNQIEIKVNDQDVKHGFKGLKNKPGSTKPADITGFVRKFGGQENTIQVTYALTTKRFAYAVYLVRSVSADRLVERIKKGNIIPREKVLHDMNKANADPDIAATSIRMSLKDPVSTMRITLPVRSSHCTHNQCFDGAMFLQLQEQAPQWSCPVCSKSVSFDSLCVDKYFEDILNRTSRAIEKVDIEPNGDWKVIKDEDDTQLNGTSSKARASYDDDFEDLVELDQPVSKHVNGVNGVKRDSYASTLSPFPGSAFSFNTPPLFSREPSVAQSASSAQLPSASRQSNKRPQSAVIDLTLSDEEDDDPPRPAKRHSTMQSQRHLSNQSNSYNTPTSLPDSRYHPQQQQPHNYSHGSSQADTYRPSSTHGNDSYSYSHNQTDSYRPSSTHGNDTYSSTTNFNAPNSMSPSNPVSPFGQPAMPVPHSRPSLQQNQQQAMFPPPGSPYVPNFNTSRLTPTQSTPGTHSGLRLPPIQPHQSNSPDANIFQGWRSDFDYGQYNHSSSPG